MSEAQKKTLYFIKSPTHNLKAIENFLTKRNYEVITESDLKTSLMKIIEIRPDFIFMAWDHPNQKIATLPKAINQSIQSIIVPYSQSTAKDVIRKLEYSGFPNKIYPPLSGPAIERLILKLQKEFLSAEQIAAAAANADEKQKKTTKSSSKEEVINVRSKSKDGKQSENIRLNSKEKNSADSDSNAMNFGADEAKETNENSYSGNDSTEKQDSSSELQIQKGTRGELLKTKNNSDSNAVSQTEAAEQNESEASTENNQSAGGIHFQKGTRGELLKTKIDPKEANAAKTEVNDLLNSAFMDDLDEPSNEEASSEKNSQTGGVHFQKSTRGELLKTKNDQLSSFQKKPLEENKKEQLKKGFEEEVKLNLQDILTTYLDNESSTSENKTSNVIELDKSDEKAAYCLSVSSSTWCGYLVAYCDINIDYQSLETVFSNWLKENFENFIELDEMDHFEITVKKTHFKSWAQKNSDYYENINYNNCEFLVCFISVDPKLFVLSLDEDEKYIEIPLEQIPTGSNLKLSLYLHLPVNKKYLLYTPEYQQLNSDQKKRLIDKNVDKLFTPAEFEKAYKSTIAEQQLNVLLKEIKSEAQA